MKSLRLLLVPVFAIIFCYGGAAAQQDDCPPGRLPCDRETYCTSVGPRRIEEMERLIERRRSFIEAVKRGEMILPSIRIPEGDWMTRATVLDGEGRRYYIRRDANGREIGRIRVSSHLFSGASGKKYTVMRDSDYWDHISAREADYQKARARYNRMKRESLDYVDSQLVPEYTDLLHRYDREYQLIQACCHNLGGGYAGRQPSRPSSDLLPGSHRAPAGRGS